MNNSDEQQVAGAVSIDQPDLQHRHTLHIGTPQPGSGDSMSRQQQQSMPSTDEIKGRWKQQVGAAKVAWGKLTEDELLKIEGHEQKLAGLIQARYAITRDEATKQVKSFFEKNAS